MSLSEKIRVELQDNYLHKMCGFCIQDMKPPLTSLTTDSVNNILSLIAAADEAKREERERIIQVILDTEPDPHTYEGIFEAICGVKTSIIKAIGDME